MRTRLSPIVVYPIWFTILLCAAAIAVSWRRRSVLDQWLMIVAPVFIVELFFSGPAAHHPLQSRLLCRAGVLDRYLEHCPDPYARRDGTAYVRLARSDAILRREQKNKLMNLETAVARFQGSGIHKSGQLQASR
jgi:hypothetical protein